MCVIYPSAYRPVFEHVYLRSVCIHRGCNGSEVEDLLFQVCSGVLWLGYCRFRAHRIGQQREVHVWSLVSEWTVEERMAFRREQKLRLDKLLVQQQIEAEAEALDGEDGEDMKEHRSETISTDEVRRLMLHGKKAIVVRDWIITILTPRCVSLPPLGNESSRTQYTAGD